MGWLLTFYFFSVTCSAHGLGGGWGGFRGWSHVGDLIHVSRTFQTGPTPRRALKIEMNHFFWKIAGKRKKRTEKERPLPKEAQFNCHAAGGQQMAWAHWNQRWTSIASIGYCRRAANKAGEASISQGGSSENATKWMGLTGSLYSTFNCATSGCMAIQQAHTTELSDSNGTSSSQNAAKEGCHPAQSTASHGWQPAPHIPNLHGDTAAFPSNAKDPCTR